MDVAALGAPLAHANPFGLATGVLDDVSVAIARSEESAGRIQSLLDQFGSGALDDAAQAATKDARLGAYHLNLEAQGRLQPHFDTLDAAITSKLRNADASLEDANWQLAKKPSPDGRFYGIDLPGSLRDTQSAIAVLRELVPA
jgi:hypothetical protein